MRPTPTVELDEHDIAGLLSCQTEVLEMMAGGAPRAALLDCITTALEHLMPGTHCSVLMVDKTFGVLRNGSAPTLPADYLAAIDGLIPGPAAGSCGTAAYLGEPVVVRDISTDERWEGYRDVAAKADLGACWSTPFTGNDGVVVGTFAVYHHHPHHPVERERTLVERLTFLASVAVEHAALFGELTTSEERFRQAFQDNAIAMALLDDDGNVTQSNRAMLGLTGLTEEDARSTRFVDVIEELARQRWAAVLDELRGGHDHSARMDAGIVRSDGTTAPVSMAMSVIGGQQGLPRQVSVSLVDRPTVQVGRRVQRDARVAKVAAAAAGRAKSEFLSAVSKEMRVPLQVITNFADLLGGLDLDPSRQRDALRHIADGASHLLALVDNTLDLTGTGAGMLMLQQQQVGISRLLSSVRDFLLPVAARRGVSLTSEATDGAVLADPRRLRQVLINLVSNSIRSCDPEGVVRLAARPDGRWVRISVTDSGSGLPAEPAAAADIADDTAADTADDTADDTAADRIDDSDDDSVDGGSDDSGSDSTDSADSDDSDEALGLGLAVAESLVAAMGGRLHLDTGRNGTTASVLLPLAPAAMD